MISFPDPHVVKGDFMECSPLTADGVRRLAMQIAVLDCAEAVDYLDGLEAHMLKILRIRPNRDFNKGDRTEIVALRHSRRRGILVDWVITTYEDCMACDGRGNLRADGMNGKRYTVECPECYGGSEIEAKTEEVTTDIDGEIIHA